jgi:hypothetical protein
MGLDGGPGQAVGIGGRMAGRTGHVNALQDALMSSTVGATASIACQRLERDDGRGHRQTDLNGSDGCPVRASPDGDRPVRNPMPSSLVWRHMQTVSRRLRSRSRVAGLLLAVLIVPMAGACSSAAPPAASSQPGGSAASRAPGTDPNTSVGIDLPAGTQDPALIDPLGRVVVPKPGQLDVRAIPAQTLAATADRRRVTLTIDYTSGVEPCYVLDSIVVAVDADAKTFAITLREGHGPEDVMCIEIAESKRTVVDLGDLAPGTYTISDTSGGATPITITVD